MLTDLEPKEAQFGDRWTLTLGYYEPFEIGFYRNKHPSITEDQMRYSALVNLLIEIGKMMKAPNEVFENWLKAQKMK